MARLAAGSAVVMRKSEGRVLAYLQDARSMIDGRHGARAPLPTLRRYTVHCVSSVAGFDADFGCCALEPIS